MVKLDGKQKLVLTASLNKIENLEQFKELSEVLKIPDKGDRQPDLTYMSAVLVSSGMNLNGAYFLPSEIISAFNSISNKPLDIEHEELGIVGHLTDAVLVDRAGALLDVAELASKDADEVNKLDAMDILVLGIVYKDRFPEVAEEILSGSYSVSMECYYSHYDVIIGDVIIPADSAGVFGGDLSSGEFDILHAGKSVGTITIGRVLRNIIFSGAGFVVNPANPRSVILEAASEKEKEADDEPMKGHLDISALPMAIVDSSEVLRDLVRSNYELSFAMYTGAHKHRFVTDAKETTLDGGHGHALVGSTFPEGVSSVYVLDGGYHTHKVILDSQKAGPDSSSHTHLVEVYYKDGRWEWAETAPAAKKHSHELSDENSTLYGGSHAHVLELEGTKLKTVFGKRSLKKFLAEDSGTIDSVETSGWSNVDGRPASPSPGHCVNFKKYVYEFQSSESDPDKEYGPNSDFIPAPTFPGAGDMILQNMTLEHTHWCTLFDTSCTTLGGDATSGNCLRNVLNRTTKEHVTDDRELMLENRKEMVELIDKVNSAVETAKRVL